MKSVRLTGLAASTALALILALSSQPGLAQSTSDGQSQAATSTPEAASKPMAKPAATQQSDAAAKPETAAEDKSDAKTEAKTEAPSQVASTPAAATPTVDTASQPAKAADTTASTTPNTETTKTDTTAAIPSTEAKPDAKVETKPETKPETNTGSVAKPAQPQKQAAVTPAETPSTIADTAVADTLKDMISGRLSRYVPRKDDRAGVEAFYKQRDYKPLWVANGAADTRAKTAIDYLASVAADGLNPSDYPTPDFDAATTADDLAAAELKLTNAVLVYAHDAQVGRIHFTRVGSDISFKLDEPDPAAVLTKMAETQDVAAALDGYNPPQAGFKALKAKLAELRKGVEAAQAPEEKKVVRIPNGRILRPGMRDPRVVQLRKRLEIPGDKNNALYDDQVVAAVKAFQKKMDLGVDGMTGPNTVLALNGGGSPKVKPKDPIETVIVNMERWRWLPRKLGNSDGDYVVVNVPDYTLSLMHENKLYWKTNIVVGKPGKATPMTSAEMKYITVNPTWNVPPSIIENEYLPALEQDPTVLDRYGLKVEQAPDGTVRIWQPPGAGNALGRIRFNFPNKFLVYQHDTPDKYLFKRAKRAYSHGCMRVQNPVEYAHKLLSLELPKDNYTPARIEGMFGNSEININFPQPIPVHLTYQTAFVDHDGKLQFRQDIYGRDARMMAILKNARERRIAYVAVALPPNTSAKPVRAPIGMFPSDGDYGPRGPGLFDFLFGARSQPGPRYYRSRRHFIGPNAGTNGHYTRR